MTKLIHVAKAPYLVMNPADPSVLTSIIPGTTPVQAWGHKLWAVPHTLDAVRVLRNLGAPAPSPILARYGWAGRYAPFFAQRETAAFMTLNRRCFVLNDMGCVDADTEYLSPTGWARIADYQGGQVGQYVPETGAVEFVEPAEYVKRPCDDMFRVKTKYGIDQLLSPEHRVLLEAKGAPGKRETISAAELYARQEMWVQDDQMPKSRTRIGWAKAAIPVTFRAPGGSGLPMTNAQIRLQVAVIADAHFPDNTLRCVVRLKKTRKVARLRQLLAAAEVAYKERAVTEGTAAGYTVFSFDSPTGDKVFGAGWWQCTPEQLAVVADEVMHWDGSISDDKPSSRFSTLQKESADFVQYAFAGTGKTARVTSAMRDGKHEYNVQVRDNGAPLQLASLSSTGQRHRVVEPWTSPDGFKYCFVVPSTYLLFRRNGCVFASGNTGKTLASLWAFDYLRSIGVLKRIIIFAPLSTLDAVWGSEVMMNFPHLRYTVLHAERRRRLKLLESDFDVYIVNHDGAKIVGPALQSRPDINCVLIDELSAFRNHSTDRFKVMSKIAAPADRWVWGMGASPRPNEPADVWAQVRIVNPGAITPYFKRFKEQTMRQVTAFKWEAKETATEIVRQVMQPAIRFSRADCVDLPPTTWQYRTVELTQEQRAAYDQMRRSLKLEYESGAARAVNEADKAMKLVQIACGAVTSATEDDEPVVIPNANRLAVLKEIIEEAAGKVIVFVPFIGGLQVVHKEIAARWPAALVYGATPRDERTDIFHRFQHGSAENLRVIVANPKVMSHGLTLTAADTIVWFAPTVSYETFDQANHRIIRPSQTKNTLIVMLEGTPVERKIYARNRQREAGQLAFLDLVEDDRDSQS